VSELAGRRALVTGGAIRVGRTLALACAGQGMDVAIHYNRSAGPAEETADACRALGVHAAVIGGDLSRVDECRRVVAEAEEALGGLDALVNSASNFIHAPLEDLTPQQIDLALDVNLKAPFFCAQAAAPGMLARGWGRIVNLTDVAGLEPWPRFLPHCISKAGLVMLTKSLAQALAPSVLVNAIAPGTVLMPEGSTPAMVGRAEEKTPLGQVGTPEDVAQALVYLLKADYVTGETLVVDGGRLVRA
jgi:NAD(P)-dependent dehydrogenase (short-subunit alcohol dehydrogenase family)